MGKSGEQLALEVMEATLEAQRKGWLEEAVFYLTTRFPGQRMTGEQMRRACQANGIEATSPHAWGALVGAMASRELILRTGEWVRMQEKSSHGRYTPVWFIKRPGTF